MPKVYAQQFYSHADRKTLTELRVYAHEADYYAARREHGRLDNNGWNLDTKCYDIDIDLALYGRIVARKVLVIRDAQAIGRVSAAHLSVRLDDLDAEDRARAELEPIVLTGDALEAAGARVAARVAACATVEEAAALVAGLVVAEVNAAINR